MFHGNQQYAKFELQEANRNSLKEFSFEQNRTGRIEVMSYDVNIQSEISGFLALCLALGYNEWLRGGYFNRFCIRKYILTSKISGYQGLCNAVW